MYGEPDVFNKIKYGEIGIEEQSYDEACENFGKDFVNGITLIANGYNLNQENINNIEETFEGIAQILEIQEQQRLEHILRKPEIHEISYSFNNNYST